MIDPSSIGVSAEAASAAIKAVLVQQGKAVSQAAGGITLGPMEDLVQQLSDSILMLEANGAGGHGFALLALLMPTVMAIVAATAPSKTYAGYTERMHPDDVIKLSPKYCPDVAAEYFRQRPVAVAVRAAQVGVASCGDEGGKQYFP